MRILFVCTGNTCRSPMAEGMARKIGISRGWLDFEVGSAGTSAHEGSAASDDALLVGLERGFDLSGHRARQLTRRLVADADLVLTMGEAHLERALALGGEGRAFLLHDYASRGASRASVSDPIGGGLDVYRATADELADAIVKVLDRIEDEREASAR